MLRGVQLGVSGGPISLLLLPKCPLCLTPLLAALGIAIVPNVGLLYAAAAVLIVIWLSVVLVVARRHHFVRIAAPAVAVASAFAVASQSTLLLWSAAAAMVVVGALAARGCVIKGPDRVHKCEMEG